MAMKSLFSLMAEYNRWMNERLYETVSDLGAEEIDRDRGAFFGSIGATLNHIMVGDLIWLNRFKSHPANFQSLALLNQYPDPAQLRQQLFSDFELLTEARLRLDQGIVAFCQELTEHDCAQILTYKDLDNNEINKPFAPLVQHFFNHQTHHRGQITALVSQLGIDPGVTDLNAIIPQL